MASALLQLPRAEGGQPAGRARLTWPEQADPRDLKAPLERLFGDGTVELSALVRGRMPSVSRGEARLVALLVPAEDDTGGLKDLAKYLRHGAAGTSPPKAAELRLDGGPAVLLTAHRTQGAMVEVIVKTASAAAAAAAARGGASAHVPSAASAGRDISRVAAAAAAADAPAVAYVGDDASLPPRVAAQRRRLFEGMPAHAVSSMRLDDVALFSVTAAPAADAMTRLVLRHAGPGAAIIDGTACVGGNTISFARAVDRVLACEVSAQRCDMLAHNLAASLGVAPTRAEAPAEVRAAAEAGAAVTVFHGAAESLLLPGPGDAWPPLGRALFLDPPWGGPEYKKLDRLSLYLGDTNVARMLARIARTALDQRAAGRGRLSELRLVALKGPFNLDVEEVLREGRGALRLLQPPERMERGRVLLLLLGIERPKRESEPGEAEPPAKRHAPVE